MLNHYAITMTLQYAILTHSYTFPSSGQLWMNIQSLVVGRGASTALERGGIEDSHSVH